MGLGFVAGGDGILRAPVGSVITLKPIAQSYYELKIGIGGNVLSCIVPAAALKIAPPSEAVVDVDTLIVSTVRRRPWGSSPTPQGRRARVCLHFPKKPFVAKAARCDLSTVQALVHT